MRWWAFAALGVTVLIAGCGGGSLHLPPPEINPPGLTLELTPRAAEPGGNVQATVRNRTAAALEGGLGYRLERWEGAWRLVNPHQVFILILVVVDPGRAYRQRIEVPDDAEAGTYRVTKHFSSRRERVDLYGRFRVKG